MKFEEIKGFGAKRIQRLKDNGIENVSDLLTIFPYEYIDLVNLSNPNSAPKEKTVTILACVKEQAKTKYIRKGLFLTTVLMESADETEFSCGWFNRKYIKNTLTLGKAFYVIGKVEKFGKKLSMNNPTLIAYADNLPPIYPVYRPIKGIPTVTLTTAIDSVLDKVRINSYIDDKITKQYGVADLNEAFREIHRPKSFAALANAKRSASIHNLSCNMALYSILKQTGYKTYRYMDNSRQMTEFLNGLPFALTSDQEKAVNEIISDMNSETKMNRLLQGDVGCGKTIVALTAMLHAAMSGMQSVLMSPTELLARQHYETAKRLFKDFDIEIAFLSSSTPPTQKATIYEGLASGRILMAIGTHALIVDSIEFKNLSLIVTDEQQRFGVKQRGALENKAQNADYLVMSATPIPRTLALTLYGDLNHTQIRSMPSKKATTLTRFVPQKKMNDMFAYVKNKAENGEQTFLVCPRVEDDELMSVTSLYDMLVKTELKPYIGILHGQMSDEDKEAAMRKFASGKTKVLITTSIIEVGIDIPLATTIVIFNSERFGLSQLHQLRGRVGRGSIDSYCFLLSDIAGENAIERLEYFISCTDGFRLAEYDFKIRGAGDFLGTRQHGSSPLLFADENVIEIAHKISSVLSKSETFKSRILSNTAEGQLAFIENLTMN